ncbi:MAG: sugar phosphate isomerase/epimerase [Rhodobacteraceae bacterium]|nr:sugar phosphate isomerase/epimerase [Paracoccaceae bacterium]
MTRKLGCCTWIFGDASLEDIARRVKAAGLDGVELHGDIHTLAPQKAREILAAHGLEIFSITPADADISHPDATKRKSALDYYDRLMDWAKQLGTPLISCHGQVKRIKPVTTQVEENALLVEAVKVICSSAKKRDLNVVFEILNRYETHQIRTVQEGLALLNSVGASNLKLLPDAYHMNIEEADPPAALRKGGSTIGLYHAADSNREGIGLGHTDFAAQISALDDIFYTGPIILEVNAPGPNPFTPEKADGFRDVVTSHLQTSVSALRALGT